MNIIVENELVMKAIQLLVVMYKLRSVIIYENKLRIFIEVFQKPTGKLGESYFTYYSRDGVNMSKKHFSLVD